jgi:hypothetical protein
MILVSLIYIPFFLCYKLHFPFRISLVSFSLLPVETRLLLFISEEFHFLFQNVNASFDKNKTLDVVIFEDANLETGFSLNQVYNIRKADNSDLYLVVIARQLGIKSLRDLDTSSLPLLINILGKGQVISLS